MSGIYYDNDGTFAKDYEPVGEVDFSSGSYEFDILAVWRRRSDGQLVWGESSGCSCYSPFEDVTPEDLDEGTKHSISQAIQERLAARPDYSRYEHSTDSAMSLIERLMA